MQTESVVIVVLAVVWLWSPHGKKKLDDDDDEGMAWQAFLIIRLSTNFRDNFLAICMRLQKFSL